MITIEENVLKCWAAITIPNNQIIIINNIEPIYQKCWAVGLDEAMSSKLYYHYQSKCLKNAFLFKIITKVLKTLGRRRLQSPRDGGISSQLVVQPLVVVQPLIMLNPATTGFLFKTLMSMCFGLYQLPTGRPTRSGPTTILSRTSLRLRKTLLSMCAVP